MVYVCIFALGSFQARTLKSDYDITGVGDMYSGASVQVFNSLTMNVQHDIYEIAGKDPDRFEDSEFQQELNQRLAGKYSFLVIRKGEEIIFSGNAGGDEEELKTELPDYRLSLIHI